MRHFPKYDVPFGWVRRNGTLCPEPSEARLRAAIEDLQGRDLSAGAIYLRLVKRGLLPGSILTQRQLATYTVDINDLRSAPLRPHTATVYELWWNDALQYIGSTKDLRMRLTRHAQQDYRGLASAATVWVVAVTYYSHPVNPSRAIAEAREDEAFRLAWGPAPPFNRYQVGVWHGRPVAAPGIVI